MNFRTTESLVLIILVGLYLQACSINESASSQKPGDTTLVSVSSTTVAAESPVTSASSVSPYPNDFGPSEVDISLYSAEHREGYKLLQDKCARCHTVARPLNSQFLELSREEQIQAKKNQPEIFKDHLIWEIEESIWQKYVKRMVAKPGSKISADEGKKILKFLVEDSKRRKFGDKAEGWKAHRSKLLSSFKVKYPERYEELFK